MKIRLKDIIITDNNPREEITNLESLKQTIDSHGVLSPITLRRIGSDKFELVTGHRRLQAMKELGIQEIEVADQTIQGILVDIRDHEMLEHMLIENLIREDLTVYEKAKGIKKLMEQYPERYPDQETVAKLLGVSQPTISNWLMLLETVPEEIQDTEITKDVDVSKQVEISRYIRKHFKPSERKKKTKEILTNISKRGLSKEETKELIKEAKIKKIPIETLVKTVEQKRTISIILPWSFIDWLRSYADEHNFENIYKLIIKVLYDWAISEGFKPKIVSVKK